VDIREIDLHDEPLVRRHWEVGRAAEAATRPYDFYWPWESARLTYSEGRYDLEIVLLGAFDGEGELWGASRVEHTVHDNLHVASATYHVHPDRWRHGMGRALAEASFDVARRRGRRLMTTEAHAPTDESSPGLEFARSLGFTEALQDGMKIVDLHESQHLWPGLAAAAESRHRGYRIVTWLDLVPEELVDGYCRLNELFFEDAPMGDLDVEPERWDEKRVRERESRNSRQGRHCVSAGAVAPDGDLVGFTEVVLSDHTPTRALQSGTIVAAEHRGHRLGTAMKVANHRQLLRHFPRCRLLMSGNADVNAAMNTVNQALGYREVERCVELQREI